MSANEFDVIIVGAGPGGYVGAIRAAQLGLRTALVEAKHLGGVCLNWGCIPTKALLRSAEVYRNMQHAEQYGLKAGSLDFDLQQIVSRSRGIAKQLSSGVAHLLKKNNVTVFHGSGKLLGGNKLSISGNDVDQVLQGNHIVIATGARPRIFPGLEPDGKLVWTSKEALIPKELPESLLVIGSGAIGIEFASFYNSFGSDVTVVEVMDQIMPVEDREIAEFAQKSMEKQGIKFHIGSKVVELQRGDNRVTATIEKDGQRQSIEIDRVITAVGVTPNTEEIGLDVAGVKLDEQGFIRIDTDCKTSAPGIYAIGDVAGTPCLAHKASHEAIHCMEQIAGLSDGHALDKTRIPGCTYCYPQVASIGLTEAQAKADGYQVKVGRFPFLGNGKAIALGEAEGLVKTVFDGRTGELLGAHLVGAEVTELIQGFSIAKSLETTEKELMETVFPHPTLSEMMHEAVLDAYERTIHY
ncbi:dihydrolipoyl dehydrogenase [uncultured Desulfuromusa sp.]|uniref:dihydrolipoyl dehydrogenase n=1 Tax=uncultured Desulfuromusa sp. TaxID=219183 RepID=UPI002AA7D338|nr:dihydrolipoyl dehydrogenase [uncultured Desulfuromusa sp.]